jgi:nucleoid DNA-binding protein
MSQKTLLATVAVAATLLATTDAIWCAGLPEVCAKMQKQKNGRFDEEEWEGSVSAGYNSQTGVNVGIGISHKWEEEAEQKFKFGKALKKAANVLVKANELGLLEEDEIAFGGCILRPTKPPVLMDEEEEQKFKLGKALKKAVNVVVKAKEIGLFEEDMDAEQKFKLGSALKKIGNVAVKAQQLGLLDEEEEQGFVESIVTGVVINVAGELIKGGIEWARKTWKFDEEEEQLQIDRFHFPPKTGGWKPPRDVDNTPFEEFSLGGVNGSIKLDEEEEQQFSLGGGLSSGGWNANAGYQNGNHNFGASYSQGWKGGSQVGGSYNNGGFSAGVSKTIGGGWGGQVGYSIRFDEDAEVELPQEAVKKIKEIQGKHHGKRKFHHKEPKKADEVKSHPLHRLKQKTHKF